MGLVAGKLEPIMSSQQLIQGGPEAAQNTAVLPLKRSPSYWQGLFRRTIRSPQAIIGGVIVLLFDFIAVFGQALAPKSPTAMNVKPGQKLAAPGGEFLMGTDDFGRDIFSRILHGAGASFQVGIFSVGIALIIGTFL